MFEIILADITTAQSLGCLRRAWEKHRLAILGLPHPQFDAVDRARIERYADIAEQLAERSHTRIAA